MNKIVKLLTNRAGELTFSLVSGAAYFLIVLRLIQLYSPNAMLIGFYFSPVIICGMALVLIKTLRNWKEQAFYGKMQGLFWAHVALMIVALAFLAEMLFL